MSDDFTYSNVNPNTMSHEEFERYLKYSHARKYPRGCGSNWASGCDDCLLRLWEESKEKER